MTSFAITWDYRCPFARNAHEHVIAGLRAGAGWDVRFVPFSLGQVHVAEGEPDVWSRPESDTGLLALQVAVVVRDRHPDRFLDVHEALFAPATTRASTSRTATRRPCSRPTASTPPPSSPRSTRVVRCHRPHEHTAAPRTTRWGVPTFIHGDQAVRAPDERPRATASWPAGPSAGY